MFRNDNVVAKNRGDKLHFLTSYDIQQLNKDKFLSEYMTPSSSDPFQPKILPLQNAFENPFSKYAEDHNPFNKITASGKKPFLNAQPFYPNQFTLINKKITQDKFSKLTDEFESVKKPDSNTLSEEEDKQQQMGSSIFPSDSMIQSIKSTLFKAAKPSDMFDPMNKGSIGFNYSEKFALGPSCGLSGAKENEKEAPTSESMENTATTFQSLVKSSPFANNSFMQSTAKADLDNIITSPKEEEEKKKLAKSVSDLQQSVSDLQKYMN